ncbi:MAG: hypothetical protein E7635_04675 [Ruminococcaceae bacterium]|nr:hypothetical protein [Oscillospiraceae bacterium]
MKKFIISILIIAFMLFLCICASAATLESFELNIQAYRLLAGESIKLTPIASPSDAEYTVTYTTDSEAVAKVDNTGKITAVAAGDTYITATTDTGLTSKCHVFVYDENLPALKFIASDYTGEVTEIVVNALGDSITQFASNRPPVGNVYNTGNYHDWWGKWYHVDNVNYGIGGTRISGSGDTAFVNRYVEMGEADMVVVMGGTNDFWGWPAPQIGGENDRQKTTIRGAVRLLIEGLIEKYPDGQIVFLSPTRNALDAEDATTTNGDTKDDFVNAITDICNIYNIHIVDLFYPEELDFREAKREDGYYGDLMPDGTHPSPEAHKIIANYVLADLEAAGIIEVIDSVIIESGKCGDTLEWTIDHRNELVITGTGAMADYEIAGAPWAEYATDIVKITFDGNVTSIGNNAFAGMSSLPLINVPGNTTTIGTSAFAGCTSLKNLIIPTLVTNIGENAFNACSNLAVVTIPESVTAIGDGAFANCADTLTIRSFTGSAAETYASTNSITFIEITGDIPGDVDVDGKVDSIDVIKLARHLATWTGYENINMTNADVDGDGEITVSDSAILARHWAGWIKYQDLPYAA